jgi:hypothetical protein
MVTTRRKGTLDPLRSGTQELLSHVQPRPSGWRDLLPRYITREGIVVERHIREGPATRNVPGIARGPFWSHWLPPRISQDGLVFEQDIREGRFQRMLALAAAASAFFSWAEAWYSHYKNNFRYKIQWSPSPGRAYC